MPYAFFMRLLIRLQDPFKARLIQDALSRRGIECRLEGQGMQALMPLAGIFDVRILVRKEDHDAAMAVLADLGLNHERD